MTEQEEYRAFLDALKPGDKITYVNLHRLDRVRRVYCIAVTRRTATQIVCTNQFGHEERYRVADGRKVGGSGFDRLPCQASKEEIAKARSEWRQYSGARVLSAHKWDAESLEVIESALKLIEKKPDETHGDRK